MTKLQDALYPHQHEALKWLLEHPRTINGSVMGTGKTIELLALAETADIPSTLVICPPSLILEWREQIDTWLPEQAHRFDITNYESLRNSTPTKSYALTVFDECHKLKNPLTKQTQGAFKITAPRTVLMSGTPMQNGPQDLWSLLHIVSPKQYDDYWRFVNTFCYRVEIKPGVKIITGFRKSSRETLRAILHRHMIRHEKDVLNLIPKMYRDIPVELTPSQRIKYDQMEQELFVELDSGEEIRASSLLARVTRLRQICLEPTLVSKEEILNTNAAKTLVLLDLLDSIDTPVIVYSYFERYLRLLHQYMPEAAYYAGPVTNTDKYNEEARFKAGDTKVFLGSLKTAGVGLNLQIAQTIIFMDLWWNPTVNEQAEDRAHRIGQEHELQIIRLSAYNTIEDALRKVVRTKEGWISDVVAIKQAIALRRDGALQYA